MKLKVNRHTLTGIVVGSATAGVLTFIATGNLHLFAKTKQATYGKISPTPRSHEPPTAVNIPRIHKNLPIKPAHVVGNNWDLFSDAVAWLSTSAVPGEGNVILYAHDWVTLWADLALLKPGDSIEVTQGSRIRTYIVTESKAVDEHDIKSILSSENRLTLYTCEGNFDQKRRVVYAAFKS